MPASPKRGLLLARVRLCARLLLACACVLLPARASAADAVGVEPVRVSAHVWYVQGRPGPASAANRGYNSNAGFVVTPEGVVVIDALGTPALGHALLAAIRSVSALPVRRVIVTHYHADHFYGLAAFKAAGADIWAHQAAREYLDGAEAQARLEQRRRVLAPWVDDTTQLLPPDRWLDGDSAFVLGGMHFDLMYMGPAHAPDDLVVVVREDQVLFSGDIMFSGRVPFVGSADSRRWLAAMDQLLRLQPKAMVPGHGAVSRDPAADLAFTRDYLRYLRASMGKAAEEMLPFDEAYRQTDWDRYRNMPAFDAANRVNAYGTYLLMERELLEKK
jgi:glyoxylase-like metal-dependent hydrolase (beta-lactamase superfamily II)